MTETPSGPTVIVVGAGVVGCSIAMHLARAGATVSIFDRGAVCAGMSARSGALVRMHYTYAPEADLAWKSLAYFENWAEMVGGKCGFVRTGFAVLVGDGNAAKLRANVASMRDLGIETEILTPGDFAKLEPATRLDDVALTAYEPRSGYADPVATTAALAQAAERAGATFNLNLPVSALAVTGGRCAGVTDASGKTHMADFVCVAAGPWTDALLAPFGATIGIKPERAQIAFFGRPSGIRHCTYIDTIAGSYFRPHGDDLTMAGLGALAPDDGADPDEFREANDAEFIAEVRARLANRIPAMAAAPYVRGHAGIYDVSPDARPVMGAIADIPALFVAAGFSGTGFKTSPAVGAAMAELILHGKSTTADLAPFSIARIRDGNLIQPPNEYSMGSGFGHKL